jgi:glycosyltransferase involved in cell wall biosynthesis
LWTPFSTVVQDKSLANLHNGVSDYYTNQATEAMLSRWPKPFRDDPLFHPKLSLRSAEFLVDNQIVFDGNARVKEGIRVMAFPLNQSGTGRYRCIDPLHQLERQGQVEVIWLPTHEFHAEPFLPNSFEVHRLQPDVVFIQQALSDKHYAYFIELKQRTGLPFVFSVDDLLMSLPDQSNRKSLVFRDMRHRLRRTLALCDRLVVTTPTLAEAYADFIDDIVVIPNALDTSYWTDTVLTQTPDRDKPRVGWAGATQHSGDLVMLKEVVIALADSVDWIFMGMCPDELQSVVKEIHPFVSFTDYPSALAELDLDLAIAPLENNAFNQAKSNLRLLEYGIYGWPVIASKVTPYIENAPPVMLVDNTHEAWITAIKAAIAEPDNLAAKGNELKNWVLDNYNLTLTLPRWLKAISF